jgi:hypothetical protein
MLPNSPYLNNSGHTLAGAQSVHATMSPLECAGVRLRMHHAIAAGATDVNAAFIEAVRAELRQDPLP